MVSTTMYSKARRKSSFSFIALTAVSMRSRAATITAAMIGLLFFQALSAAGALAQSTLPICGGPPICGPTSDTLLIKSTDVFGNTSVDVQGTFIEGSSVGPEVLTGTERINDSFQPGIPAGFDGGFRTAAGPSSITVGLTDVSSTAKVVVSELLTATVDPASITMVTPNSNLCTPPEFCFVTINWTLTSDDESAAGLAAPPGIPLVPELSAGNQLASFFKFQFTYQGGSLPGPFSIGPSSVMVTSDVETVTPPTPEPSTLLLLGSGLASLGAWRRKMLKRI
jgi:PEP-CTERM motif